MSIRFSEEYNDSRIKNLHENLELLMAGRLPLNDRRSGELFSSGGQVGSGIQWAAIWSLVGETVVPIAYALKKNWESADMAVLRTAVFEFAGSEERLIWAELDGPLKNNANRAFRGKQILKTVVHTVADIHRRKDTLFIEGARVERDAAPLDEIAILESKKVVDLLRWVVLDKLSLLLGTDSDAVPEEFGSSELKDKIKAVWLHGVLRDRIPMKATPALVHIARTLGQELMPTSEYASELSETDPVRVVYEGPSALPKDLADKFFEKQSELLEHKRSVFEQFGYEETGISDNGTSELDRVAVKEIFRKRDKESIFVFAPTSSGKTRLAQFSVVEAVTRKKEKSSDIFGCTIVLAPTKALVNQIARDFRNFLRDTGSENWVVIEGTRDHPQYNDHLRSGKFDIAVVIPEKLSSMMRLGMSLKQCPLIVLDEFQHLVDGTRGLALEMLLIDVFKLYPHLRWVALSASLGTHTRQIVKDWLDSNNMAVEVIDAKYRPVPLTVRAVSERKTIEKQAGKNATPIGSSRIPAKMAMSSLVVNERKIAQQHQRQLEVLFSELENYVDDFSAVPSILFFVPVKSAAIKLAKVTQSLLLKHFDLERIRKHSDPFIQGRFGPLPTFSHLPDLSKELSEDFRIMSPSRLKDQVAESVLNGVGFHTATLNAEAREIIEESFTKGYIRILFATDTLKLGVNLPSDIVINGDMYTSAGDRFRLIDKDTVIQRLGRAGRLGFKPQGIGELVVPNEFPHYMSNQLEIRPHELEGLGGENRQERKTLQAVTDAWSVFDHYLRDWAGGAEYSPPATNTWILDATLRLAASSRPNPRQNYSREELIRRATDLHSRSLCGAVGQALDPAIVHGMLQGETMFVTDRGEAKVTRLGWALASNSVSIENSPFVRDLAEAARQGAGPFTLLYIACSAPLSMTSVNQMTCRVDASDKIIEKIYELAGEWAKRRRDSAPMLFRHFNFAVTDAVGSGLHADQFRGLVNISVPSGGEDTTALWRALVLMMWWSGEPMGKIDHAVNGDAKWLIDEVSVHQLAESVSYLLGAAADLEGVSPLNMTFRTLQHFASEIEIGLPTVFASLLRVNHRSMNRHRLIGLIPYLDRSDIVWDGLDELLKAYAQETGGFPPGASDSTSQKWAPLTDEVLEKISSTLQKVEASRKELSYVVPPPWDGAKVPYDSSSTIGEIVTNITDRVAGADEVLDLLSEIGFTEDEDIVYHSEPYTRLAIKFSPETSGTHTTYIETSDPDCVITHKYIDTVIASLGEDENCVIIDTGGCSHGVIYRSDFHSDKCVVIHPNLFVEMIARVYEAHLSRDEDGRPVHFDEKSAKETMARMFVNSAPVLNRADLENRLAGMNIVQV